jgi:hypothetical protein
VSLASLHEAHRHLTSISFFTPDWQSAGEVAQSHPGVLARTADMVINSVRGD